MFVRAKQQGGRVYHYLVTAERCGGRVQQKTVAYLGDYPSVEAALEGLPAEIAKLKEEAHECAAKADALRQRMLPAWIERNDGEVPRARQRGGQIINKMFSRYWSYSERAQLCEQRAREKAAQLDKLHRACSAQKPHDVGKNLGTTPKAKEGALCVRWERHGRGLFKHGSKSYRLAVLARRTGGIVCSLARLREEHYNDPKFRPAQEIMFWKDTADKLDTLRLDPSDRAKIEAQLSEIIRCPSQDEIRKYDEEKEAWLAGFRKLLEARSGEAFG